nr:unnamed protein product [Digitaria exilis]
MSTSAEAEARIPARKRILSSSASLYVGNAGVGGSRARFAAGDAAAGAASDGRFARWSDIAARTRWRGVGGIGEEAAAEKGIVKT